MEGAGVTTTTGAAGPGPGSVAMTPEGATVLSLPEGSSMMIGEDGEQYVTIQQDGQTYAIPLSEYQSMQPGGTITIQAQQISDDLVNNPPQVVVQQATPTSSTQVRVSEQRSPQISPQKSSSSIKWQSPSNSTNAAAHRPWVGSTLEPKKFKPIKVDNWGIFLLSRLQTYFQKKEYTDLTLRFPSKNAQIKVHKLVVNACTDYFIKAADLGLIQDGIYDMPPTLLPEYVAPIIRFMYTGRLDLKSHMFEKMKATSTTLGMSVLTKLLDAQINAPPEVLANAQQQKKPRRMDPVRQIKQIKKIEKKFEREQRRSILERQSLPAVFVVPTADTPTSTSIVPGKKLPIWKKRETQVNTQQNELDIKHEMTPPKSYGKKIENGRQLREIQENANFEKLRVENSEKDMSVDEIKEFMDDQRVEIDEDDYYDNDAGLDYDEALEDEEHEEHEHHQIEIPKPILKSAEKSEAPPRKSVRFSLRPGSVPKPVEQPEMITPDTPEIVQEETVEESIVAEKIQVPKFPPKKRKSNEDAMDKTVDEFSKVIEQEESETRRTTRMKTRKGRIINPPNLDMPSTPKSSTAKKSPALSSTNQDHTAMIGELMRKNPDLFKGNKPVKIKVMSKDANGKNSVKVITVKAQPQIGAHVEVCTTKNIDLLTPKNIISPITQPKESQPKKTNETENEFGLRTTPKVKYTGKRGRPPIIKPGESDPHAKERKEIASKMQNNYAKIVIQTSTPASTEKAMESDTYTTFEQVSPDKLVTISDDTTTASTSQLDPSSEAEALSHVASGIAASLGLAAPADSPSNTTTEVPIEHLEELDFSESNVVQRNPAAKRGRPSPNSSLEISPPPRKVSKLALEWDEEEEKNT